MRTEGQIRKDVYSLRERLKARFGMSSDFQLIEMSLAQKLVCKQLDEIDSVFSNYSAEELAIAHDLSLEADVLAAMADEEDHPN